MKKIVQFLTACFVLSVNVSFAQVFWTENFNNGCTSDCIANTFTGVNGTWTISSTGTNQAFANEWYVSCAENGEPLNSCGAGCGNNATLHVGSSVLGDLGAAYYSGAGSTTNKRAESPVINCTGKSNITVDFKFIQAGQANVDVTTFYYFDGATWNVIQQLPQTNNTGCGGQGRWTAVTTIALPASADNNPNVKIGFNWSNNNSVATDPSFAVDDVTLSAPSASNTITTGLITGSPFCAGATFLVPFTSTGTFAAGNVYTAQLSDASGSFASPVNIGTLNSIANSGNISVTIPGGTASGSGYLIRIISSNPATTGSSSATFTVNATVTPAVTISASPGNSICAGDNVTFTASPVNGGTPSYQWLLNGGNVGTNSSTFSSASLSNGDIIEVTMSSTATCASPVSVNSNQITVTLNPLVNPSVTITASPSTTICAGDAVSFTATPVNGGTPSYQWLVNGSAAGTNSATFTSSTLQNGDIVEVTMTSTASCASPANAGSNQVTMTVNPQLTPSVSITSSTGNTICAGTPVTFSATIVNGGTPTYAWFLNGINTGVSTPTYSNSSLNDGDQVQLSINSTASCVNPASASSNVITINVVSSVVPSVVITPSTPLIICAGDAVTFSSVITNGGPAPQYQWNLNGTPIPGANSDTYSSNTLNNGDQVTLTLTSNDPCASVAVANSNTLIFTVNAVVAVSVAISASPTGAVCPGDPVDFTAVPAGGGISPAYQWNINGITVGGATSSTFNTTTLNDGDIVTVTLTSSELCSSGSPALSNSITQSITVPPNPSVSLSVSPSGIQCIGTALTFTANPTDGGTSPVYEWLVDGVIVSGVTGPVFTSSSLNNGQTVTVNLYSNAPCADPSVSVSDNTVTNLQSVVVPSVSIAANPSGAVCNGQQVDFSATSVNGGSGPAYQWYINGIAVTGANASVFSTSSLLNGDVVTVELSNGDACVTGSPALSNSITMIVNSALTASVSIVAGSNPICAGSSVTFTASPVNGGTPTFQWYINGVAVPGQTSDTFTSSSILNGDQVSLEMTSSLACVTSALVSSNIINMTTSTSVIAAVNISVDNDTICSGTDATFTAVPVNGGSGPVYQWNLNGIAVTGAVSSVFVASGLNDGDQISVTLTSNDACVSVPVVTSNIITQTVLPSNLAISAQISGNTDTICQGGSVIFSSVIQNGGLNPQYQWSINNVPQTGANSNQFSTNLLSNSDVVTLTVISSLPCLTSPVAVSNALTTTVLSGSVNPTIVISASDTSVCSGSLVNFNAVVSPSDPGDQIQWMINGLPVPGGTGILFSSSLLNDGDSVTAVLTPGSACAAGSNITSLPILMDVGVLVSPSCNISVNSDTICSGTPLTFTAVVNNAGTNPVFEWLVNGNVVTGATGLNYINGTLVNGDQVSFRLTSSENCVTSATSLSNTITITVLPPGIPNINIVVNDSVACLGELISISASADFGGDSPIFNWYLNGVLSSINGPVFETNALNSNTSVYCVLTSNYFCRTKDKDTSRTVQVIVKPAPEVDAGNNQVITGPQVALLNGQTNLSDGVYQWSPSVALSCTDCLNPEAQPGTSTLYTLVVTDPVTGCSASDTVRIEVISSYTIFIPNAFSPDNTGVNNVLYVRGLNISNFEFKIFDRWGNVIFTSTELNSGWDGTFNGKPVDPGAYVYVCTYTLGNGEQGTLNGKVTLFR